MMLSLLNKGPMSKVSAPIRHTPLIKSRAGLQRVPTSRPHPPSPMGISEATAISLSHRFSAAMVRRSSNPASAFRPRFFGQGCRGSRGMAPSPLCALRASPMKGAEAASRLNTVGYQHAHRGRLSQIVLPNLVSLIRIHDVPLHHKTASSTARIALARLVDRQLRKL